MIISRFGFMAKLCWKVQDKSSLIIFSPVVHPFLHLCNLAVGKLTSIGWHGNVSLLVLDATQEFSIIGINRQVGMAFEANSSANAFGGIGMTGIALALNKGQNSGNIAHLVGVAGPGRVKRFFHIVITTGN